MTMPEPSNLDQLQSDGAVILKRALIGIGGGLALIFLAGMIAGFSGVAFEQDGPSATDLAILLVMVLAALSTIYAMWRFWPRGSNEPVAPRVKSARMIMIALVIVGAVLGFILGKADVGTSGVFSNAAVGPGVATISIALWLIVAPTLTWLWWKRVDEHEASAYRDSTFIAAHAYMFVAPSWWMASRAGWLPDQQPMIVLLIVSTVWAAVWFVKKYF